MEELERELAALEAEAAKRRQEAEESRLHAAQLIERLVKEAALMVVGNQELQDEAKTSRDFGDGFQREITAIRSLYAPDIDPLQEDVSRTEVRLASVRDRLEQLSREEVSHERVAAVKERVEVFENQLAEKKNHLNDLRASRDKRIQEREEWQRGFDDEQTRAAQDPIRFAVEMVITMHHDAGEISDDDVALVTNEVMQGITDEALAKAKEEKPTIVAEGKQLKEQEAREKEEKEFTRERASVLEKMDNLQTEVSVLIKRYTGNMLEIEKKIMEHNLIKQVIANYEKTLLHDKARNVDDLAFSSSHCNTFREYRTYLKNKKFGLIGYKAEKEFIKAIMADNEITKGEQVDAKIESLTAQIEADKQTDRLSNQFFEIMREAHALMKKHHARDKIQNFASSLFSQFKAHLFSLGTYKYIVTSGHEIEFTAKTFIEIGDAGKKRLKPLYDIWDNVSKNNLSL